MLLGSLLQARAGWAWEARSGPHRRVPPRPVSSQSVGRGGSPERPIPPPAGILVGGFCAWRTFLEGPLPLSSTWVSDVTTVWAESLCRSGCLSDPQMDRAKSHCQAFVRAVPFVRWARPFAASFVSGAQGPSLFLLGEPPLLPGVCSPGSGFFPLVDSTTDGNSEL